MSTRKNPVRKTQAASSQPQQQQQQQPPQDPARDSPSQSDLGPDPDIVTTSAAAGRPRPAPAASSLMTLYQSGTPLQRGGHASEALRYDEHVLHQTMDMDPSTSPIRMGGRPLHQQMQATNDDAVFTNLISPTKASGYSQAYPHHPLPYDNDNMHRLVDGTPAAPPTPINESSQRTVPYNMPFQYTDDSSPPDGYPVEHGAGTLPRQQQSPQRYRYEQAPPLDALGMSSPFNPAVLPPESRIPPGYPGRKLNYIVQSPEHVYALMSQVEARAASAGATQHHGPYQHPSPSHPRPGHPGASVPYGTASPSSYADPHHPSSHQAPQHQPPREGSQGSGPWSAQQSPVPSAANVGSTQRTWQISPRAQGEDPASQPTSQSHPARPPSRVYANQAVAGWPSTQEHIHDRGSPASPTQTPYWQSGPAPQQPNTRHNSTSGQVQDGSWSQGGPGDPSRQPPGSMVPANRWSGAVGSSGSLPQSQQAGSEGATDWSPQGSSMRPPPPPPPSSTGPQRAGSIHQHPHPSIDGRADDHMRWSSTPSSVGLAGAPPAPAWDTTGGSANMNDPGQANRNRAASIAGAGGNGSPGQRPQQTGGMAPWKTADQMNNPSGVLPPDGRIQTPGGTGASFQQPPLSARPPTAGAGAGPYGFGTAPTPSNSQPSHSSYGMAPGGRPGSVHGQQHQQQQQGNETPYGSQPDSMAGYRTGVVNAPPGGGGGMPPSEPGGYVMASGPQTANPYPSTAPPMTGANPYGVSRPPTTSAHQQQQQTRPGAPGNMYPDSAYAMQQPGLPPQGGPMYPAYGGPPGTVAYAMNPNARLVTRMTPGGAMGVPMHPYAQPQPPQAGSGGLYGQMGQGGVGMMNGYRPQQH